MTRCRSTSFVPSLGVKAFKPYVVPRLETPLDLFLDGNEGAVPPVSLLSDLARLGPELMRRYPDARALEAMLAARLGVAPEQVIVTAGADDAIDRACRAVLAPGREMILPVPTFEMFERYAKLAGGAIRKIPWLTGPYPTAAVRRAVSARTALVAVVSPNNPTGAVARAGDLARLAAAAPGALLVVDLAYAEFADEDLTAAALALPNAVVTRSFSKAWGMAGLRVGYAVGPAPVIGWMRSGGAPYAVSRPSLAIAAARLSMPEAQADMKRFVKRIRREREGLSRVIRRLGGEPFPSQANFVLARFKGSVSEWVREALAGLGIGVRAFPERPDLAGCLRLSCPGEPKAFARLSAALETALAPQALLLDMDGVLADVSGSYRQAIARTAASFGVRLTRAQVSAAKREPDSNNDWEVTRRLIQRRGAAPSLAEVTRRFEALYQGEGTAASPGLRSAERLIPDRTLLARLAQRVKLAVVTGRPRADAAHFLKATGIDRFIATCVSMEDAPPKPDPAPVRLALKRLGVRRAWFVGDAPDDMRAARAAGIVPVGFVAPGEAADEMKAALARAGAGRVVRTFGELEGFLT